jgi:hypothetical protein
LCPVGWWENEQGKSYKNAQNTPVLVGKRVRTIPTPSVTALIGRCSGEGALGEFVEFVEFVEKRHPTESPTLSKVPRECLEIGQGISALKFEASYKGGN